MISDLTTQIIKSVYPIGSIYSSTEDTSPATLFGFGTWDQIKDRFLLAAGDTYAAGNTGGAANHTLTVDEMPSHSHTFTGSSVNTGNNSVGHTHTYTDYYATTTGSTTLSVANLASHNHGSKLSNSVLEIHGFPSIIYQATGSISPKKEGNNTSQARSTNDLGQFSGYAGYNHVTFNLAHTHDSNGSGTGHTHSGANTSTTRTSNGISANHTHSVTAKGSNSNTGGGSAFSVMPPYLAVYMWKRTA